MPKAKNAKLWERDPDDWYVEPGWVSERLFEREKFRRVIDPCAGTGRIVEAATLAGVSAIGADIVDRNINPKRAPIARVGPFKDTLHAAWAYGWRAVVTNPPYRDTRQLVDLALLIGFDCAVFTEMRFLAGDERSRWLESKPLAAVYVLTPRPSCPPGAVILAGEAPGGGSQDFCWLIFRQEHKGPPTFGWLRKEP